MAQEKDCKFCNWQEHYEKIWESVHVVAVWGSPYVKGHIKIILKRHADNLIELSKEESHALMDAWQIVGAAVEKVLKPDIINWQINGNWVRHIHGHIYPRWQSDKDWGEPIALPTKIQDHSKDYKPKPLTDKEKKAILKLLK